MYEILDLFVLLRLPFKGFRLVNQWPVEAQDFFAYSSESGACVCEGEWKINILRIKRIC